jgi:hypothetical protein
LVPVAAQATSVCRVTFSIDAPEPVSVVEIRADYSSTVGTFEGVEFHVECLALTSDTSLIARDTCTAADNYCYFGAGRAVNLIASRASGFDGQIPLVACNFASPEGQTPTVESFAASVRSAISVTTEEDAVVSPTVSVAEVDCSN